MSLLTAVRELANKVRVYRLVRYTARGSHPGANDRWEELVRRTYQHDPFSALFRLERLGHDLAATAWDQSGPPRDLLRGPRAAALPERSLILLHGGMGLALADRLLATLGRDASERDLAAVLAGFVDLCRENARPGHVQPAWETLGVVVRLFHSRWTATAGRLLGTIDADARGYFWHGVGRAIYFLPGYLLPGTGGRALARCRCEPIDAEARSDALHGFFFAAAMVNLRHPVVLERVLARAGERPDEEAVVTGGFTACLLARHHTTPGDPAIRALLAHHPAAANAALWERRLREPVERMLTVYYPLLAASGRMPELARHHYLPAVVAPAGADAH